MISKNELIHTRAGQFSSLSFSKAMKFAASILKAVDISSKASKILHFVVLGVKDDPDNVRQAASAIEGLRSAFGQLLECRTLDRSGS